MLTLIKNMVRRPILGIRRDASTGHLVYKVDGTDVHLRFSEEAVREPHRRWWFDHVYFRHYCPSGKDCVVDFGAGLGIEVAMLAARSPGLRYVAVEVQPWVYECLSLTLHQLPAGFEAFGLAVGGFPAIRIAPTRTGLDASMVAGAGTVTVGAVDWMTFTRQHEIDRIDLLKINIEGAEAALLDHAGLGSVQRVVVAVHDWRADLGHGEAFRTRARVERRLADAGFKLRPLPHDWIYAERDRAV